MKTQVVSVFGIYIIFAFLHILKSNLKSLPSLKQIENGGPLNFTYGVGKLLNFHMHLTTYCFLMLLLVFMKMDQPKRRFVKHDAPQ